MAVKQRELKNLGVLLIDFNPVIREGLQAILAKAFSAPTVAGAAALLLSAHPGATPDQIRGALLSGANPKLLDDASTNLDQGYGFLDVLAAHKKFGTFNPFDWGLGTPMVRANVALLGIRVIDAEAWSGSTGWLLPGQRKEFYVSTTMQPLSGMTVKANITAELPADKQNQVVGGDDAIFTVATAVTSTGDYVYANEIWGSATVNIQPEDLDFGLTRVTVMGDNWNAGRIKADVSIFKDKSHVRFHPIVNDMISSGDWKSYTVNIPAGVSQARFATAWLYGWEAYPTDDLDMYFFDPAGNYVFIDNNGDQNPDGAGLDDPEKATLVNPVPGKWTIMVNGYTVWQKKTQFTILSDMKVSQTLAKNEAVHPEEEENVPGSFELFQNYPNPFNPSTVIRYGLPVDAQVNLALFNILGEKVATVVNEPQKAGYHEVVFNGSNLASGTYIYRIQAGNFVQTRKLALVK